MCRWRAVTNGTAYDSARQSNRTFVLSRWVVRSFGRLLACSRVLGVARIASLSVCVCCARVSYGSAVRECVRRARAPSVRVYLLSVVCMCSLRHGPSRLGSCATQVQMRCFRPTCMPPCVYDECLCPLPFPQVRSACDTPLLQPEDYFCYCYHTIVFGGEYSFAAASLFHFKSDSRFT